MDVSGHIRGDLLSLAFMLLGVFFCLKRLCEIICHPLQRPVRALSVYLPLPGNNKEVSLLKAACLPPPRMREKWFAEFSWPIWSLASLVALLLRMPVNVNLKVYASLLGHGIMPSASLTWVTKQLSSNNVYCIFTSYPLLHD